jgi:hypothetical protein
MEGFTILFALLAVPLTIATIFGMVWLMAMTIALVGELLGGGE